MAPNKCNGGKKKSQPIVVSFFHERKIYVNTVKLLETRSRFHTNNKPLMSERVNISWMGQWMELKINVLG